jgi:anti-sigma factor RsiW
MTPTAPRGDTPLSEADIHAYADGVLAAERAARVHRYLGARPGEARRAAFYARLNAQIRHAFQAAAEPLPRAAAPRHAGGAPAWRSLRRRIAQLGTQLGNLGAVRTALALVVAAVAASGWIVAAQVSAQALDNAAVMALEQASALRPDAAAPPPAAPGGAVAPDLSPLGLRLADRRLVQLGPFSRATAFVYLNGDGKPVVLLRAAAPAMRDAPQWIAHRVGSLRLLTWTARHERYVLAGRADTHGLMHAADALSAPGSR